MDYDVIMFKSVAMIADQLTTDELVALNMAALVGMNPVGVMGYEKAKNLFTEDEGTHMHATTRTIFNHICQERIQQPPDDAAGSERTR